MIISISTHVSTCLISWNCSHCFYIQKRQQIWLIFIHVYYQYTMLWWLFTQCFDFRNASTVKWNRVMLFYNHIKILPCIASQFWDNGERTRVSKENHWYLTSKLINFLTLGSKQHKNFTFPRFINIRGNTNKGNLNCNWLDIDNNDYTDYVIILNWDYQFYVRNMIL